MERVWLCGPIVGIEDHNRQSFLRVAAVVESLGFHPINPLLDERLCLVADKITKLEANRQEWLDYIERKLLVMATCHAVYVFGQKEGYVNIETQIEVLSAIQLGLDVFKD